MADSDRLVRATFFAVLGLVAAFAVSAVAGLWRDGSPAPGIRTFEPSVDRPEAVRVEVLNGAGRSGLARDATYRLRGIGFDVVFFGNADHFRHERSVVVDRVGRPRQARAVADALEIDSVATAIDSTLLLEVTVVLGGDWPPTEPPAGSWLDRLRRLVRPDAAADTASTDEAADPEDAGG